MLSLEKPLSGISRTLTMRMLHIYQRVEKNCWLFLHGSKSAKQELKKETQHFTDIAKRCGRFEIITNLLPLCRELYKCKSVEDSVALTTVTGYDLQFDLNYRNTLFVAFEKNKIAFFSKLKWAFKKIAFLIPYATCKQSDQIHPLNDVLISLLQVASLPENQMTGELYRLNSQEEIIYRFSQG